MMAADADVELFAHLIESLHPWLSQVVIIGGWAHRLYRLHPLAQPLDYEPLRTLDTDVAIPAQPLTSGPGIRECLLEGGFREKLLGDTKPPVAHYLVASDNSGFYAEFLTPLEGGELKRGSKRDETARIAGIFAQKLRHVDLLLNAPWEVEVGAANGYPTQGIRRIRLPNAAAFLAQKILIHDKRDRTDRAKDVLYIHDTIETFGRNLLAIREEWKMKVRPGLHVKAARQVEHAGIAFFRETNDTIREAALIGTGRNLSPEMVREVCIYGWQQIFS